MDMSDTGWRICQAELEKAAERTLRTNAVRRRLDVADVVQDGLIQIWLRETEERELNMAFVRCIARGHALKSIRTHTSAKRDVRRECQVEEFLRDRIGTPVAECLRRELASVLGAAVEQLEPIARYIIRRHVLEGHSLHSVADSLGRTTKVCRTLLRNSLRHLRSIVIASLGRLTGEHDQVCH